ncbi:MAG TPA: Gfo/Idh/MocA family oxidoreductase [Fimbriimonas sp.]|nr:Gfo/Idh/MocA family oxidoreductase [Fimbriimonas sp.]
MSERIRIGIIGCGQIAQQHMSTYSQIDGAEMVAFADLNEEAARTSCEKWGVKDFTTNFRDLLQRDDIDAIDVCLHNNFHMPATVAVLEAGKHAYCEKPMAGSYRDAVTMLETARSTGKKLHIQLATLYSNETRATRELIDSGELGDVYHARSVGHRRRGRPYVDGYGTPTFVQKRNSAGGALYDMGVYHISQCLYLLGNPSPKRISGKTYQKIEMDAKRRETSGYDVEELGLGFVRLEGGLSMDIFESWAANLDDISGSVILGSKAGVRLDPFGFFKNVGNLEFNSTASLGSANFRWSNVVGDHRHYENSQAHWISALQGQTDLLPTAEIALNTMLISEGIYMSQTEDREVTAEEVLAASKSTAVSI